jgi:hypothetical protein
MNIPTLPDNDHDLFALMKRDLFTAVVGDVLDSAGLTRQFLPPEIRALSPDMMLVGRAMPVLEADCFEETVTHTGKKLPFGVMFRALDDLKRDEVYICTGSSFDYALWGELMSTRARHLGASGAVVDGFSRDTKGILKLGFPTFSRGTYAQDQRVRGRVIDFRCSIGFPNGVRVQPGDVLFGDIDGVVVIPSAHLRDIVQAALEKVFGENKVANAIRAGMSTQEAWDTYGIM